MSNVSLPSTRARLTLGAIAAAMTGLAIYQWLELLSVREGHQPLCAVNETLNCTVVWNSAFASKVHALTGLPVAGWGVVWGVTALGLVALLSRGGGQQASSASALLALRFWGLLGIGTSLGLGAASFKAGALCLTCLGTYALVIAFFAVAWKSSAAPFFGESSQLKSAIGWTLLLSAVAYGLMLYPGSKTPKETVGSLTQNDDAKDPAEVFKDLPAESRKLLDDVREDYRQTPAFDTSQFKARSLKGAPNAHVKIIDFTDLLCGHCRALVLTLAQIEKLASKGQLSVEARNYPLDGECNPHITQTVGDGVRCLGAKALICLEGTPEFWQVREKLFESQRELDKERVMRIATSTGMSRSALEACVNSAETKAKLDEDIRYATMLQIKGTPLVLLNGKPVPPYPPFLLGMVLAQGNVDSPVFSGNKP